MNANTNADPESESESESGAGAESTKNNHSQTVVIKRIKKVKKDGHHGGAWKIAYADFITAMMAFFLLMWLLAMLNKYQREGVAEYFQKSIRKELQEQKHPASAATLPIKEVIPPKPKNQTQNVKKNAEELLLAVKKQLEESFKTDKALNQFVDQLDIKMTAKGLKITLHDVKGKPLFMVGESQFESYAKPVLAFFGQYLSKLPYKIQIMGHTDDRPYDNGDYTNWELSSDRANATRRALTLNGLEATQIRRIIGLSDTEKYEDVDGEDPKNRRVDILILKPKSVAAAPTAPPKTSSAANSKTQSNKIHQQNRNIPSLPHPPK